MTGKYNITAIRWAVMLMVPLWGCTDAPSLPTESPDEKPQPISLAYSRAESSNDTEEGPREFMAWCDLTYSDPSDAKQRHQVFETYLVKFDETIKWYYHEAAADQVIHYWNNSYSVKQYNFDAISPVGGNYTYSPYSVTIPEITGNIGTDIATDWLVASHCRKFTRDENGRISATDQDLLSGGAPVPADTYYSTVSLCFHHILSAIDVRLCMSDGSSATLTAMKLEVVGNRTIYTKGKYNTSTRWRDLSTETAVITNQTSLSATINQWDPSATTYKEGSTSVLSHLEIPQPMNGKSFSLTVTIDGIEYTGVYDFVNDWTSGTHCTYYFTIDPAVAELIYVDIDVAPMVYGGTIESDIITNW